MTDETTTIDPFGNEGTAKFVAAAETCETAPEEDDDLNVDTSDAGTPEEILADKPVAAGMEAVVPGTAILSPLAAMRAKALQGNGPGAVKPPSQTTGSLARAAAANSGEASGGRGRGTRGPFFTLFDNCDFEPDNANGEYNRSSRLEAGAPTFNQVLEMCAACGVDTSQIQFAEEDADKPMPGIAVCSSYWDAYDVGNKFKQHSATQFGVKWTGNGKLCIWTTPAVDKDGKQITNDKGEPLFRTISSINPPQNVIDLRESTAKGEKPAPRQAGAGGTRAASSSSTPRASKSMPFGMDMMERMHAELTGDDVLDVDGSDVDKEPKKNTATPPTVLNRQQRAVRGEDARLLLAKQNAERAKIAIVNSEPTLSLEAALLSLDDAEAVLAPAQPEQTPAAPKVSMDLTPLKYEAPQVPEDPFAEPPVDTPIMDEAAAAHPDAAVGAEEAPVEPEFDSATAVLMPVEEEQEEKPQSMSEMEAEASGTDENGERTKRPSKRGR